MKIIPLLGGIGWVRDPKSIMTTMLAHALVSDYSQSTIYYGTITSLAYLVAKFQTDQDTMARETEATLKKYYSRIFTAVDISVTYSPIVIDKYNIYISITGLYNGISYSLAVAASVDKGVLNTVVNEVNK